MDDEEEIHSHASPAGSDSADNTSPSPPAGRITVTVAASSPLQQDSNPLALALTVHGSGGSGNGNNNFNGRSGGGGGGREDCWSEGATAVLIDAWGERYLELSRGNLKQKHWKEVAGVVSSREDYTKTPKTDIQCKNRIDTVKKKYKQEKIRMASGGGPSRWIFFDKLDSLIGTTTKITAQNVPMGIPMNTRSSSTLLPHRGAKPTVNRSNRSNRWRFKKRNISESESESEPEPELSADSADSLPPPPPPKRKKIEKKKEDASKGSKWGELTKAISRFGEAYEQAENLKIQQVVELEKERMKFVKELELQRMQYFVKTQLEISQIRSGKRRIGNSSNDHGGGKNNHRSAVNNDDNSDFSS